MLLISVLFCILVDSIIIATDPKSNVGLSPEEIIRKYGYKCEIHYITTEDGYILRFYRIPSTGTPVLVMHGLMSSSANFVNSGPDRSLGFLLSKLGYDVWLGNTRGNMWSRNHTSLDPVRDARAFWDFSFHEIGIFDLPAAIDYVLLETGAEKVQYIGHSQGSTAFLVMTSVKAEYNDKIALSSLMAPASFMEHLSRLHGTISRFARYTPELKAILDLFGLWEIPLTGVIRRLGQRVCSKGKFFNNICARIFTHFSGGLDNEKQLDETLIPVYMTSLPGGASSKQIHHYAQLMLSGGFLQYDYGMIKNLVRYGSTKPPPYDLTKVTAPVAVYYSLNDLLVARKDVEHLIKALPNVVNTYVVPFNKFSHMDFIIAKDVVALLYKNMTELMSNY